MNKSRRQSRNRAGVMLFAVLVCVGVALALTMTAMQTSLQQRRHLSRTLQLEQTRILLDAAEGSKPFKQWVADQEGAVEFKPLKMTLELPTGKAAAISATAADEESFLLTALIGDADNEISVTRRSRSVGKDD